MLDLNKILMYLKNKLLYKDYERQIVGESVDYFGDLWHDMGGEISNHVTALLVKRMEKGFKNGDHEQGYREGIAALGKLYSSCAAAKKPKISDKRLEADKAAQSVKAKKRRLI